MPGLAGVVRGADSVFKRMPAAPPRANAVFMLPQNAAVCKLPFFCRQELHFEQRTGLPLRFRVGSVANSDWLEGKPGAASPR